jgi:hypothetical protein
MARSLPAHRSWNEGLPVVIFAGHGTHFPQVIGLPATKDAPLLHQMPKLICIEGRARQKQAMREEEHEMFFELTFWIPNILPLARLAPETTGRTPAARITRGTCAWSPPRCMTPRTAGPSHRGTSSMWQSHPMIWRTSTWLPCAQRSSTGTRNQ